MTMLAVDTVSEMSTKVDHALTHISITVETVSGMSTGVDLQCVKKHPLV